MHKRIGYVGFVCASLANDKPVHPPAIKTSPPLTLCRLLVEWALRFFVWCAKQTQLVAEVVVFVVVIFCLNVFNFLFKKIRPAAASHTFQCYFGIRNTSSVIWNVFLGFWANTLTHWYMWCKKWEKAIRQKRVLFRERNATLFFVLSASLSTDFSFVFRWILHLFIMSFFCSLFF
jgi:hypothetical protein